MTPSPRRPSMTDVADRAGVSYQTVSRVLNEAHRVKPSTRARVEAAIEELGFTRNRAARALRTTRSRIIGVLTDGSPLYGPATTLAAVESAAHAAGYTTLLSTVQLSTSGTHGDRTGRELLESGADGIIVIAPHEGMMPAVAEIARTTPIVSVTAGAPAIPRVAAVAVDQERGARSMTEHLVDIGSRSVVHLPGPTSWFDARGRREGFEAAAAAAGIDAVVAAPGDWSARSGFEAGLTLLRGALPDAVFAANDLMALGLLRALASHGVDVPGRVAVAGFDDIDGAEFFTPSLSSVRQPFAELGTAAVTRLLAGLEDPVAGRQSPDPGRLEPELVVRESTRATPRRAAAAGSARPPHRR